jgi:hypothetical protein
LTVPDFHASLIGPAAVDPEFRVSGLLRARTIAPFTGVESRAAAITPETVTVFDSFLSGCMRMKISTARTKTRISDRDNEMTQDDILFNYMALLNGEQGTLFSKQSMQEK